MGYLSNTAASVRKMGINKSEELASAFKEDWIITDFIPIIINAYNIDKKGYNYRISCLNSLGIVMKHMT